VRARSRYLAVVAAAALLLSCSSLGYYSHTLWGGLKILLERRAIEKLLAEENLAPELRHQLELVESVRAFASEQLSLPDNRSYRSYVAIDGDYVVWNLVAAPELSLLPKVWCFPIAGCVTYRGYFSQQRARKSADRLARRGFDVRVEGVAAYSTLGWFADPVLSTFLHWPEANLAALLFHELAHQVVYVKDDTTFNESFASVVEVEGLRRYLEHRGAAHEAARFEAERRREGDRLLILQYYRERLQSVYEGPQSDAEKRQEKARLFAELRDRLRTEYVTPESGGRPAVDLNNADLAAIGAYFDLMPPLQALFRSCMESFESFYAAAARLATLEKTARDAELQRLSAGELRGDCGSPARQPLAGQRRRSSWVSSANGTGNPR
jgi:predicted aminopeptidase